MDKPNINPKINAKKLEPIMNYRVDADNNNISGECDGKF